MFDVFLDYVKKLFKSRLFPITLIYLALFCIVINRLFILQIVKGPTIAQTNKLSNVEHRDIEGTRGNIYDCNGKLLATNELTYNAVMEDSTKIKSDEQRNKIIDKLIRIVESNGDTLDNEFYIKENDEGKLEFTVEDIALENFKKKAYAYVLDKKTHQLTDEQEKSTAQDVYDFLRSGKGYPQYNRMFNISDSYSMEETLKIMSVRYALFCNFPKYMPVTIASHINNKTLTAIEENSDVLQGVTVKKQSRRVYNNSIYFSNIIGYTGLISSSELEQYNKKEKIYTTSDLVGKAGLEGVGEEYLRGTKGVETVSVNSAKKVIDVIDRTDSKAGNDIYLTIDSNIQIAAYKLLEREIATILLDKITPRMDYGTKGKSADDIKVPIYEVYNAFINNNIIDVNHFTDKKATELEKNTFNKYKSEQKSIFNQLNSYLSINNKITNDKAGDMEDFLNYFYSTIKSENLLIVDKIPSDDTTLNDYKNNKISLSSFLKTALANNWIDLSKLKVDKKKYYYTEELYAKLIDYMQEILAKDVKFKKMVYRSLIFSFKLSGKEICLLLLDQNVLKCSEDEIQRLKSGSISPYGFVTGKIKSLKITPGMLALAPYSGSVVITDVKTGKVRALVSYPGYDNNKFSGKVDPTYFNKVNNDLATPMRNKPAFEKIAPGSTFKMVTSVAAMEEGVVDPIKSLKDEVTFTKVSKTQAPKCTKNHGHVNLMEALEVSCNYYFFDMGWRLSNGNIGQYDSNLGLSKLKKYASMFGLNKTSGIELSEAEPQISDMDSVRSAIGQGTNVYTPTQLSRYVTTLANSGTCYDLTLLDKVVGKDNKVIKENKAKVDHKLSNIKTSTWSAVHEGMYDVCNAENGSVASYFKNLKDLGITVAGKTGTSQISKSYPNNALFVSYAPYEEPKISMTVVIPNGYTSHNAAQLANDIYSVCFDKIDAEDLLKNGTGKVSKSSTFE